MALLASAPALAQPVTSPGPDSVSVTIYRAPRTHGIEPLDSGWLEGFALITEKRTITLPAGRATIRFEGVAGGILAESAIVAGLPEGVREKNLDADLLSPRSLYARSLNRPVTIRRTLGGRTVEERAIIRSGPDGAAVIETKDGIVAADCRPHTDALVYDAVPAGLSAKPTLSVETDSPRAQQVTITLSYLAWGFDWRASYIATMRPDGRSADLFAWVTLGNADVTSFADAETMVVAGHIEQQSEPDYAAPQQPLMFRCLSTVRSPMNRSFKRSSDTVVDSITAEDIGAFPDTNYAEALQRVPGAVMIRQEELGDLKLYRVPHPTTIASQSRKQVALLERPGVPVETLYRVYLYGDRAAPARLVLRAQNRTDAGLGLPLPAGNVAVFEPRQDASVLVGEGTIADKAVGEEVEIEMLDAPQVVPQMKAGRGGKGWRDQLLTVSNANPFPVRLELEVIRSDDYALIRPSAPFGRQHGHDLWATEIPANGSVSLSYRMKQRRRGRGR